MPSSVSSRVRALAFALSFFAVAAAATFAPASALPRPSPRPHDGSAHRLVTAVGSTISLYELMGWRANQIGQFDVDASEVAGVTIDRAGRIVAALVQTQTPGPCSERGPIPTSCLAVYDRTGKLLATLPPPGGDADATYTGIASDAFGNVYVSDRTFNAIFSYGAPRADSWSKPSFVAEADADTSIPSTVAVAPHGEHIVGVSVPTRCDGSPQIILYDRRHAAFAAHDLTCRTGHGSFAGRTGPLAVTDDASILVPFGNHVDVYGHGRAPNSFALPTQDAQASGLGIADGSLYVADAVSNLVYVYAPPPGGWLSGSPSLVGVYRGFANLGPIAVR